MFHKLTILFFAAAVCSVCSSKEIISLADPAIIQAEDGWFYAFGTGRGLPIYRTKDLVDWQRSDTAFDTPVPEWAKKPMGSPNAVWAPDIVKMDGDYYLYYSVSQFGSQRSAIGVARNKALNPDSPDYEWKDLGMVVESFPGKSSFNAIDPCVFQLDSGKAYMFWGSFWSGLKSVEINPETGKPAKENPDIQPIAARPNSHPPAIEAPFYYEKDNIHYLFVSYNSCCDGAESEYKLMVGRAGKPLGPYHGLDGEKMLDGAGALLLSNNDNWRGPGHNSVIEAKGKTWLVHHTYDTFNLHRRRIIQVRPLYWTSSGWPVAGEPLSKTNPMTADKANPSSRDLFGSWRLSINYEEKGIYDFVRDGKIASHPKAWWKHSGNRIKVNLPGELAQNGSEPEAETLFIEPSESCMVGRNQNGDILRFKKVGVCR
ncbi:arabinan endo-1,5-alpha-L-arabinosidase [Sedimentisphaera salicampi]|uniref:arabinan endo-1,5-alpha-L-arabinosidase n=1 Tax=Sedimentisphaera salicampi TaxID=1941349 RepID=UPI000B9A4D49|nr:arabinan endo-1,5-alpha-L-arabinosidase [Sedimentisphaera salicampi]OXU15675.1 Extracellular exo-alpha-(1->5)-L-arabinofuranosidase ArbA precursor [Sedimentisphaera salicampi]